MRQHKDTLERKKNLVDKLVQYRQMLMKKNKPSKIKLKK
jgi:hypothetical protein